MFRFAVGLCGFLLGAVVGLVFIDVVGYLVVEWFRGEIAASTEGVQKTVGSIATFGCLLSGLAVAVLSIAVFDAGVRKGLWPEIGRPTLTRTEFGLVRRACLDMPVAQLFPEFVRGSAADVLRPRYPDLAAKLDAFNERQIQMLHRDLARCIPTRIG
jgi:hypothetical protein